MNFDDLIKLILPFFPSEAEARVAAGDQEAADLLAELKDPKSASPFASKARTVIGAAERTGPSATVYGSLSKPMRLTGLFAMPIHQSKMAGAYSHSDNNIFIDTSARHSRKFQQETLLHELGHFLNFRGLPWNLTEQKAPTVSGLSSEGLADALSGVSTETKPDNSGPVDIAKLRNLLKILYGTDAPFDQVPQ